MSEFIPLSEGRESLELKTIALKLKLNYGLTDSDIDNYYEAFKMLIPQSKDSNPVTFITAKNIFEFYLNNNLVPDSMTLEDCSDAINIFSSNNSSSIEETKTIDFEQFTISLLRILSEEGNEISILDNCKNIFKDKSNSLSLIIYPEKNNLNENNIQINTNSLNEYFCNRTAKLSI